MKFGVEFVPYKSSDVLVGLAKQVEDAGFNYIWVCDHYHNRYVHSVLATLALATKRVRLGPGVTNPYLVHPAVTAAAIATLDELSRGRAVFGISAGDPTFLATVGVKHRRPIVAVREAVYIARRLLAGERVDFSGEVFTCRGAKLRFKPEVNVPIYIGGRGPKMLELAGSIADGALINASHRDDLRECVDYVRRGAESSNRKLEGLDVVAYMATSIGGDAAKARRTARTVVAFIASSAPPWALERHDIPADDVDEIRKHLRVGEIQKAAEAVSDRMVDAFAVCGTLVEFERHINDLSKLGITQVVVGSPIGPEPTKVIDSIKKLLR
ncbi:MAG: 5,10-methylenetetrahydromethanopterin reductase [Candidatus Hodarchaeaceae archaeon]|nr:5,10-methylenetetrahydromethanopterin reductase [Candidatus Hodarchaeaceae archaeon]